MATLKIYKTHPEVVLPEYQTEESACFDLAYQPYGKTEITGYWGDSGKSVEEIPPSGKIIFPIGYRYMIPTGLIFDIPKGYCLKIYPRSSTALKRGLILSNNVGIIDSDYVNEVFLIVHNINPSNPITILPGDRIAQAELVPVTRANIQEIVNPPTKKTDRDGGFGSTGVGVTAAATAAAYWGEYMKKEPVGA